MINKTKDIIYSGLLCSLVCIITTMISLPIGIFGYINFSDLLIMLLAPYFGGLKMIMIGGVGTMLADLFLGYGHYALFTLIIKSCEGLFLVFAFKKGYRIYFNYFIAVLIMLVGYGLADILLNLNLNYFMISFLANLPQAIISYLIAITTHYGFKKYFRKQVF